MPNSVIADAHKLWDRQDHSIPMGKANWYALFMLVPIMVGLGALYIAVWGYQKPINAFLSLLGRPTHLLMGNVLMIGILIAGTVLHELIHALTWRLVGKKPWSAIRFGFQWRTLTPYTHLQEPLPVRAYRIGTWMPGFLTGIVPTAYGLVSGNVWLTLLGGAFIKDRYGRRPPHASGVLCIARSGERWIEGLPPIWQISSIALCWRYAYSLC